MPSGGSRLPVLAHPRSSSARLSGPVPQGSGRPRYAVVTLGCKLNQADSAGAAGRLREVFDEAAGPHEADLLLLNTCTVTHKADAEARRLIRKLRRENPKALLCVTGCGARRDAASFAEMPEVDHLLAEHDEAARFLSEMAGEGAARAPLPPPFFFGRTRAMLKIQEGCNLRCSYCIVPKVRGRSRSVEPADAEAGLRRLLGAGFKEIVLTGINTGAYGADLKGRRVRLPSLLERLLSLDGDFRLRLNSLEPRTITPDIASLISSSRGRLCRHLQVPMQSGSDAVLAAMRRNYRASAYASVVENLAATIPGIGIGADVLVGFPTETADDFKMTLGLIERLPIAFIHAFSFSPRPGTLAASMALLSPREVAARMGEIMALAAQKKRAFIESQRGQRLRALALSKEILTDNFIKAALSGAPAPRNTFLDVMIKVDGATGVIAVPAP